MAEQAVWPLRRCLQLRYSTGCGDEQLSAWGASGVRPYVSSELVRVVDEAILREWPLPFAGVGWRRRSLRPCEVYARGVACASRC